MTLAPGNVRFPALADLPPPVFEMRLRVYYEDTDAGGIVYYANYLRYFERARTDWLRALGVAHRDLAERDGLLFVVRDVAVDYRRPARLDDELRVDVRMIEARRAQVRLAQVARVDGQSDCAALALVRIAVIERAGGRPAALPPWVAQRLTGKETDDR